MKRYEVAFEHVRLVRAINLSVGPCEFGEMHRCRGAKIPDTIEEYCLLYGT